MNTCRFCDGSKGKRAIVKYGTRHYAHADCLLSAKGPEIFNKMNKQQLGEFPVFAAKDFHCRKELEAAYSQR